jgi:hypothetical protein
MAIKYYLYISETKVEMLFAQIPRTFLSGLSAELKVNLGLLSTTLKQDADQETKFAKLTAVVRFLEENEPLGTVDQPESYFKGQMSMTWGPYETFNYRAKGPSPLVYFGGETDRTIVGLGGSSQNMIGAPGRSSAHSHSATPVMVARIYEGLELPIPENEKAFHWVGKENSGMVAMAVDLATSQMEGAKEKVEFFARRLAFYPSGAHHAHRRDMNILLGTPLYVALAE